TVLVGDVEAHGDDAVAGDRAAGGSARPAGLGQALAARAAQIARRAVVRAVVALLLAPHGPVAAHDWRPLLVERVRHALRRGHRRLGDAVGQRITRSDVPTGQAAAGLGDLEGCLRARLRPRIDAGGVERPERRRRLVQGRLTLGGVLDDL